MAYMNVGDPIQVELQKAERIGNKNKWAVRKRQKRKKVEEEKRKSLKRIKPRRKK
jgi:hypothetical protein